MPNKPSHSISPNGNVYPIPATCLQGSLAEMLFWDAIFYLFATKGDTNPSGHRFLEATYEDLQNIADLSKKTLRKMIDKALALDDTNRLWEEEGIKPYSFRLVHKEYQARLASDKVILKPVYYMSKGWAWLIAQPYPNSSKKSRLPLAVLNVLFRRPHGQTANFREIVNRCRNKKKPPDAAEVEKAIAYLVQLDLMSREGPDRFRLNRERFNTNGHEAWQKLQSSNSLPEKKHLLQWAKKFDSQRANLAAEIVELGRFDYQRHFKEIFFDLASIQNELETEWLRYVVKRKRGYRLTSKQRWRSIWKSYERKLHKEMFVIESPKLQFDLGKKEIYQANLSLDNHRSDLVRWGKLVVWVNDARYHFCHLQRPDIVQVMLKREDNLVCQLQLNCKDEVIRCDLTKDLRIIKNPAYSLFVEAERPLRQFSISVKLEAEYLPQRKG